MTRYFCSTCGANFYLVNHTSGDTEICSGALDWEGRENLLQLTDHIFLSDTKDGGLSPWLPGVKSWEGFSETSEEVTDISATYPKQQQPEKPTSSELTCYCHCRSIVFKITRPTAASCATVSGPYTDALLPPANGTRYLAGTCACHSCRKSSGFDMHNWAFVPKANILSCHPPPSSSSSNEPDESDTNSTKPQHQQQQQLDFEKLDKLKTYHSSPGKSRDFCARCGATVFWRSEERPLLLDVSVGLVDEGGEEGGARAEGWLNWWTGSVHFEEDAENKVFIGRLKEGMALWG
ncbi:MAG: hypothetical protein Q9217_005815, partial [Psora testacea]